MNIINLYIYLLNRLKEVGKVIAEWEMGGNMALLSILKPKKKCFKCNSIGFIENVTENKSRTNGGCPVCGNEKAKIPIRKITQAISMGF